MNYKHFHKKIALGMSGGVDSSVSAKLLIDQGYEVTGVYLECWRAPGCRSEEDRKDALTVALQLNIPFTVLDFKEAYREKVVEYFFAEYEAGRTPNPDVMCNKEIKFGMFYDWAMAEGFDAIATGHYAQIQVIDPGTEGQQFALTISTDDWKDQTYFLHRVTQEHLAHTLFPIGHLEKKEVRRIAEDFKLPVADKKDSVGICFIGDIDVHEFLKERLGENLGEVIDTKGRVIGEHKGLWFYTVGQRHGFTIFPKTVSISAEGEAIDHHNIPPFYVIGKHPESNQLIVGFGRETYQQRFHIESFHGISYKLLSLVKKQNTQILARIRHTGQLYPCTVNFKTLEVELAEPIQGLAEGQSAVFYADIFPESELATSHNKQLTCLGGGVIVDPK